MIFLVRTVEISSKWDNINLFIALKTFEIKFKVDDLFEKQYISYLKLKYENGNNQANFSRHRKTVHQKKLFRQARMIFLLSDRDQR